MIRAIVVEDEPLAARFLESLLAKTGQVEVVGTAHDGEWALTLAADHRPDAVFLDVLMPGRDGIQVAADLAKLPKPPLVVFTTGQSGRASDAFRLRAVDYLVKPLQVSQVREAVGRLAELIEPVEDEASRPKPRPRSQLSASEDRLPVKGLENDVVLLVPKLEILAAVCRDRRTWVHTASQEYATYYALGDLAAWLGDPPFLRISRESVVNLLAVDEVVHYGDRLFQVRLRDRAGTRLEASRSGSGRLATLLKAPF